MSTSPHYDFPEDPIEGALYVHNALLQLEEALNILKEDVRNRMFAARLSENPRWQERLEMAQDGRSDLPGITGEEFYEDVKKRLAESGG